MQGRKKAPKKQSPKAEQVDKVSNGLPDGITVKNGAYYYGKFSSINLEKVKRYIAKTNK